MIMELIIAGNFAAFLAFVSTLYGTATGPLAGRYWLAPSGDVGGGMRAYL